MKKSFQQEDSHVRQFGNSFWAENCRTAPQQADLQRGGDGSLHLETFWTRKLQYRDLSRRLLPFLYKTPHNKVLPSAGLGVFILKLLGLESSKTVIPSQVAAVSMRESVEVSILKFWALKTPNGNSLAGCCRFHERVPQRDNSQHVWWESPC